MRKVLIIVPIVLLVYACGPWKDNIHLSANYITFNANEDSTIITTTGTSWWITSISINDTAHLYRFMDSIDITSDYYLIKDYFFIVEKRNSTTIFVKVDANTTGQERTMTITFQAANFFDYVRIKQLAEKLK